VNKKIKAAFILTTTIFILSFILFIPGIIFAQEEEATEEPTIETIDIPEELIFDVTYPKLSARAGENFEFNLDLTFEGDEEATFDLVAEGPEDWYLAITPSYQESEITAIKLTPGKKETLGLKVFPPLRKDLQQPDEYSIVVTASNEDLNLSGETELIATITAVYDLSLSPKFGVFNTKATAGKNNPFIVILANTGSAPIEDITFSEDAPEKWIVEFEPEKIEKLDADESKDIEVTITPPDKTIAGDYIINLSAKSDDSTKDIDVRVTVETPSIWGWIGIGVIVLVVIGVGVIFARLGRR
jgi:uncharacterized membrane protein